MRQTALPTNSLSEFPPGNIKGDVLPFLACAVHTEVKWSLNIEVYKKPTHIYQYLLFGSSPSGAHAGGHQKPKPSGWDRDKGAGEGEEKEGEGTEAHQRSTLNCRYPNGTFVKCLKYLEHTERRRLKSKQHHHSLFHESIWETKEDLQWTSYSGSPQSCQQDEAETCPSKDKTLRHEESNICYAVQCS